MRLLHKCLIFVTITNNSFREKIHPNNYVFVSAASTEQPSDNGGQPIIVIDIIIMF